MMLLAVVVGAIAVVIYMIVVGKFTFSELPGAFATIVNIFGMLLVSVTLGFGLVSFPKENFSKIDHKKRVSKCHRMAEALKSEQQCIKEELYDITKLLELRQQTNPDGHEAAILLMIQQSMDWTHFRGYADPNEGLPKLSNAALNTISKKRII
jgi:hypothetical protein